MLLNKKRKKVYRFIDEETEYEDWLRKNPNGFVFNHVKGKINKDYAKYNKLHRAECTILHRPMDQGRRTTIEKICAKDYKQLEREVQSLREDSWSTCQYCFR